ncbi:biopolymer transporter ExbD [Microcoleus sp. FACHB-1515]|uniref:ExbD/TolR family protein n=1 Tax=Cyanophyceae TaxID=3028117 RepID=UPI001682B29D|nr:biopolymer transporter ExbD [Microcoleus sp. FACHB-1515]MBD2089871.1 biopolymer transporter ExbD [Microcoleus sp. FACHB-1515]
MRFKSQRRSSQMPEVNLVPMMDVIMAILTFFIIVSMTLTSQQSVNVTLPSAESGASATDLPDPFVVGLNQQRQIILNSQPATEAQLLQQMQAYLASNREGVIVLKADRGLAYQEVVQLLGKMRDVGGDRVSLAIES